MAHLINFWFVTLWFHKRGQRILSDSGWSHRQWQKSVKPGIYRSSKWRRTQELWASKQTLPQLKAQRRQRQSRFSSGVGHAVYQAGHSFRHCLNRPDWTTASRKDQRDLGRVVAEWDRFLSRGLQGADLTLFPSSQRKFKDCTWAKSPEPFCPWIVPVSQYLLMIRYSVTRMTKRRTTYFLIWAVVLRFSECEQPPLSRFRDAVQWLYRGYRTSCNCKWTLYDSEISLSAINFQAFSAPASGPADFWLTTPEMSNAGLPIITAGPCDTACKSFHCKPLPDV